MSDNAGLPQRAQVQFDCKGRATGKMRNDLDVMMTQPFEEGPFVMATDEGSFHGGEASAPPPLALFVAGLTGCIMTQIRAFAKRLKVSIDDLNVETRVIWDWKAKGKVYETGPHSFEIDIFIESSDPLEKQLELVAAAQKGCFLEQTLSQKNTIKHRLKTPEGWVEA